MKPFSSPEVSRTRTPSEETGVANPRVRDSREPFCAAGAQAVTGKPLINVSGVPSACSADPLVALNWELNARTVDAYWLSRPGCKVLPGPMTTVPALVRSLGRVSVAPLRSVRLPVAALVDKLAS